MVFLTALLLAVLIFLAELARWRGMYHSPTSFGHPFALVSLPLPALPSWWWSWWWKEGGRKGKKQKGGSGVDKKSSKRGGSGGTCGTGANNEDANIPLKERHQCREEEESKEKRNGEITT